MVTATITAMLIGRLFVGCKRQAGCLTVGLAVWIIIIILSPVFLVVQSYAAGEIKLTSVLAHEKSSCKFTISELSKDVCIFDPSFDLNRDTCRQVSLMLLGQKTNFYWQIILVSWSEQRLNWFGVIPGSDLKVFIASFSAFDSSRCFTWVDHFAGWPQ